MQQFPSPISVNWCTQGVQLNAPTKDESACAVGDFARLYHHYGIENQPGINRGVIREIAHNRALQRPTDAELELLTAHRIYHLIGISKSTLQSRACICASE